jgi:predicted dinucleotide-binding enzyme
VSYKWQPKAPDYPLPLPRNTRIAVLGNTEFAATVTEALTSAGRAAALVNPEFVASMAVSFASLDADVVFVAMRWVELEPQIANFADPLAHLAVVNCATSLEMDGRGYFMAPVSEGSVTAALARCWPRSRVVGALQQFTADHLRLAMLGSLRTDAPIVGDDREVADLVEALIDEIEGLESVYAGPLRAAGAIEGLAALLREVESNSGHPVGFRLAADGGLRILS